MVKMRFTRVVFLLVFTLLVGTATALIVPAYLGSEAAIRKQIDITFHKDQRLLDQLMSSLFTHLQELIEESIRSNELLRLVKENKVELIQSHLVDFIDSEIHQNIDAISIDTPSGLFVEAFNLSLLGNNPPLPKPKTGGLLNTWESITLTRGDQTYSALKYTLPITEPETGEIKARMQLYILLNNNFWLNSEIRRLFEAEAVAMYQGSQSLNVLANNNDVNKLISEQAGFAENVLLREAHIVRKHSFSIGGSDLYHIYSMLPNAAYVALKENYISGLTKSSMIVLLLSLATLILISWLLQKALKQLIAYAEQVPTSGVPEPYKEGVFSEFVRVGHVVEKMLFRIRERDKHLASIIENSPNLIFIKDSQLRYQLVNKQFTEAFSESMVNFPDKLAGHYSDTTREQLCRYDESILLGGKAQQYEMTVPATSTSEQRTYLINKFAVANDQGGIHSVGGVATDITAIRNTQAQLNIAHQIFAETSDAIVVLDHRLKPVLINDAVVTITGYGKEDIESSMQDFLQHNPDIMRALNQAGRWSGECTMTKADHSTIALLVSASCLVSERNNHRYGFIFNDISELRNALVKAESAAQAKANFLANMSHEIRTPMNAIIGLTHLMKKKELPFEQREYLQKIEMSSKGLLSILNDILDFSKIDAGRLDIEYTSFSLDEVLKHVFTLNQLRAEEKDLNLQIARDFALADRYMGDPLRLTQILTNLVSNAVKFTENGSVNIRIHRAEDAKGRPQLQFDVMDSGIGISENHLQNLFTAFSQADTSITREYGGTGLGLSISGQLAKLMGGEIHVASQLGGGSTFTLTLPLDQDVTFTPKVTTEFKSLGVVTYGQAGYLKDVLKQHNADVLEVPDGINSLSWSNLEAFFKSNEHVVFVFLDSTDTNEVDNFASELQANGWEESCYSLYIMREFDQSNGNVIQLKPGQCSYITDLITPNALLDKLKTHCKQRGEIEVKPGQSEANHQQEQPSQKLAGTKVLVVEDNAVNTMVAKGLLKRLGVEVSCCENGLEAVNTVFDANFDAVLMDIQMPVMDGYTATQRIRENPKFESLPIIALTANAMSSDQQKALDVGMDAHLSKPIDPKLLETTLLEFTNKGIETENSDNSEKVS